MAGGASSGHRRGAIRPQLAIIGPVVLSIGAAHLIRLDRAWPVHLAFVLIGAVLIAVSARAQWRHDAVVGPSRRDTVRLVLGVIVAIALGTAIQVALLAWFDRD